MGRFACQFWRVGQVSPIINYAFGIFETLTLNRFGKCKVETIYPMSLHCFGFIKFFFSELVL